MRKILMFIRNRIAAQTTVRRLASLVAIATVTTVVTVGSSRDSHAQTAAPRMVQNYFQSDMPSVPQPKLPDGVIVDSGPLISTNAPANSIMDPKGYPIVPITEYDSPYQSSNPCNSGCDVSWYVSAEALYLQRDKDEFFSLTRNNFMPRFDYELGARFTIGRLLNCADAWEFVYVGPYEWERQLNLVGAGDLQSQFFASDGFGPADVSAFNNADQQVQTYTAEMNNIEVNRRWWAWDVVSTMFGVRYVGYDEKYQFLSSNSTVGNGQYAMKLDNQMIGAQVGADILYPVGLRTHIGFRGKAGAYANFQESRTLLQNAGVTVLNSGDNTTDLAGLFEVGIFGNYQIVPSIRLTASYEIWYGPGVAVVADQSPTRVNASSGTFVNNDDDLFLNGGSVGVQILY
jgi:hypothetical protein